MNIGRKIYYEKTTGNVIVDTGERSGSVVETTQEEDFQIYKALQDKVPDSVGCAQLDYGEYADRFGVWDYRIDVATEQIVWTAQVDASIDQAQAFKRNELSEAIQTKITAGYESPTVITSTGQKYAYGTSLVDQQNMTATRVWSDGNPLEPVGYRPSGLSGRIMHTRDEFVTVSDAVFSRTNYYLDQADLYIPLIYNPSATVDDVNSIVIAIADPV